MQNTKFRNAMKFCSAKFPNATEEDSNVIDTCVNKYNKANHLFYDEQSAFGSILAEMEANGQDKYDRTMQWTKKG